MCTFYTECFSYLLNMTVKNTLYIWIKIVCVLVETYTCVFVRFHICIHTGKKNINN